jgi:methyl-accepting chemotaxis protein
MVRNSEAVIEDVLAKFEQAAGGLTYSADVLRNESDNLRQEISSVLVSLQFQDRVSQILGHVCSDQSKLEQRLLQYQQELHSGNGPSPIDVSIWLEELAQTYTTTEQRTAHGGTAAAAAAAEEEITFF